MEEERDREKPVVVRVEGGGLDVIDMLFLMALSFPPPVFLLFVIFGLVVLREILLFVLLLFQAFLVMAGLFGAAFLIFWLSYRLIIWARGWYRWLVKGVRRKG